MTNAVDQELDDVAMLIEQARASAAGRDWLRGAQALLEVQDKIGRVLREMELLRSAPSDDKGPATPP